MKPSLATPNVLIATFGLPGYQTLFSMGCSSRQAPINFGDWRRAIRDGECEIYVRGYSHVFISGPTDSGDCSSFSKISGVEDSYQEVFARPHVRDLVLKYFRHEDPAIIREDISSQKIWEQRVYRKPTDRNATESGEKN